MKFPRRLPHFRSIKFAPFALISLFLFSNLTGLLFSRVMAPDVVASTEAFQIPADIPTSGDQISIASFLKLARIRVSIRASFTRSSGRSRSTKHMRDRMRARRG